MADVVYQFACLVCAEFCVCTDFRLENGSVDGITDKAGKGDRKEEDMRKQIRKAAAIVVAGMLSLTMAAGVMPNTASAAELNDAGKKAKKAAADGIVNLDEGSEYHAYLLFQARESWVGRARFFEKNQGVDYEHWDELWTTLNSEDLIPFDGTKVEDATIKGNGHYTVKVTGIDGRATAEVAAQDPAEYGILGFTTDIPYDKGITIDNVKVKIDGMDKGTRKGDEIYYDKDDIKDPGLITVELVNSWHDECQNKMGLLLPRDSVEISFDVSGFNYDNPDAVETPAPTKEAKKTDSKKSGSTNYAAVVGGVVVVIIVIAGVVVAVKKKKK